MTQVQQTTRIKNKTLDEVKSTLFSYDSIIETFKSGFDVRVVEVPENFSEGSVLSLEIFKLGILCPTEFKINSISETGFSYSQKKGLLKKMTHELKLVEMKKGINVIDDINYEMPFGLFGHLTNDLFLRTELKDSLLNRLKTIGLK